jgi:protein-S-isoprenylcysteine O-methyltransferase Ste14
MTIMYSEYSQWFRSYFLTVYGVAVIAAAIKVMKGRFGTVFVEKIPPAPWRWFLPGVLIPLEWLVPIGLVLTRKGEIPTECVPSRLLGLGLSCYGSAILVWTWRALGRFLVPRAVVFKNHQLITTGPFRFIRHPTYSGVLALWLGAGFGTLNGLLIFLFPVAFLGFFIQARIEEELLEEKFGEDYRRFAQRTPRFIPGAL